MYKAIIVTLFFILLTFRVENTPGCQPCYEGNEQKNCEPGPYNIPSYMMHMSVHPHLDAFWIFDFESYYDPDPSQGQVRSYFASNRFNSVKQIFDTTLQVLTKSKKIRQTQGSAFQKAHRSFFNSQMGFFKRWFSQLTSQKKQMVKQLLKTKYWQIVGGGFVQHDQGCAYYDDIIQNFQLGLHFLKDQFGYYPRAAISADSFGHSQSTLAILAHLGVQGFFVQRSDEHILLQNKTQFVWKAKSANGKYYGALPTHIRWAIHGFQDQFIGGGFQQNFCQTKSAYIGNVNRENEFLKRILKSNHIMRYFGHDFQRFDQYSYQVIESFMEKFSMQKCRKLNSVYGNPTQYFMILMGEVFNKTKPTAVRQEDIMPIWDYDSGLYWTGYYTTDPFHKKNYRDAGKYLYAARKAFASSYILDPNSTSHKQSYKLLQQFSETVAYLQHHDGITGTSKYEVMDKYEKLVIEQVKKIKNTVFDQMFQVEFPTNTNNKIFECNLDSQCEVPKDASGDLFLKVFKTGENRNNPIIVHLQEGVFYEPDCQYEVICMCTAFPCPCDLYIYPRLATYSLIKFKKVQKYSKDSFLLRRITEAENEFRFNETHLQISYQQKQYSIGYKRLNGDPTPRNYKHLSRYGDQVPRSFSIRSGKYALGSNLKTEVNLSKIKRVLKLESDLLTKFVVLWNRQQMKTIITIRKNKMNEWKVQTLSSAQTGKLEDLYLEVAAPHIINNKKFYTDSNGWLVMKRELFKHQDYEAHFSVQGYDDVNGNSYPMTAFAYIQNEDGTDKLSINTERPQGVIAIKQGTIWVNYDRLSSDDGKWVYQNTFRTEYQKFTHYITVGNNDNNQRVIQKRIDQPLIIQGNSINSDQRVSLSDYALTSTREIWEQKVGIRNVKFQIKPWNDSSVLLRVFNMWDEKNVTVEIFSADNVSTFLTAFYGNQIEFTQVFQTNLGGNIKYEDFINKKWNWNSVINLDKQNEIFNKKFGQKINLRPLEIRTFVFTGVRIKGEECKQMNSFKYNRQQKVFELDKTKLPPSRTEKERINEKRLIDYQQKGNLCTQKSPTVDQNYRLTPQLQQMQDAASKQHQLPVSFPTSQQQGINTFDQRRQPQPRPPQPRQPQNQFDQADRNNQLNQIRQPNQVNKFTPLPPIQQNKTPQQPSWIHPKPEEPLKNFDDPSSKIDGSTSQIIKNISDKIGSRKILSKAEKQTYFSNLLNKVKVENSKKSKNL